MERPSLHGVAAMVFEWPARVCYAIVMRLTGGPRPVKARLVVSVTAMRGTRGGFLPNGYRHKIIKIKRNAKLAHELMPPVRRVAASPRRRIRRAAPLLRRA